jgi:hypothetical protein
MAPVPYSASGRLDIIYVVSGKLHKTSFPVDIAPVSGIYYLFNRVTLAFDTLAYAVASNIWGGIRDLYNTGVAAATYELFTRSGTSFIPVESGTCAGGAGSSGTASALTGELTMTFKNVINELFKSVWLETILVAPQKQGATSTPAAISAFMDSAINTSVPGNIGNWVESRGSEPLYRKISWTVSLNRRLRRDRSYA